MKKLLALLLALVIAFSGNVIFAFADDEVSEEPIYLETEEIDPSTLGVEKVGKIENAEEPVPEEAYSLSDAVRVSIILSSPSTSDAGYSLDGIAQNSDAIWYRDSIRKEQDKLTKRIENAIGKTLDIKWNLTLLLNAISAEVTYGDIVKIKAVEGVKDAIIEREYSPMEASPNSAYTSENMVGATEVWSSGYTGAGSIVAVIDTGIDTTHQSFAADSFNYSINRLSTAPDLLTSSEVSSLKSQLNGSNGYYVSSKIPFGYNYVDRNTTIDHMSDTQGEHGSHVAGIAAANMYIKSGSSYVKSADQVDAVGMAPDAQLLVMKVFGANGGASDSDYMAAIEDAIVLGADSINLSLGSSTQGFTYSSSYQSLLNSLSNKSSNPKAVVSISAGNSYALVENLDTDLYIDDVSQHTGGSPGTYINSLCVAAADKDGIPDYYSSWGVPGSLVMKPEITAPGSNIFAANGTHRTRYGTTEGGSSKYEYMSGTSMAAPHIAGLSAVLNQYLKAKGLSNLNPELASDYSIRAVNQSLLMSTAQPITGGDSSNSIYRPILQQGAGMVNVSKAVKASSVIMMGTSDDTLTAKTGAALDGKVKAEFGDDPEKTGVYSYSFTIYNTADVDLSFDLNTSMFTQDYYTKSGKTFMSKGTREIQSDVIYSWEIIGYEGPSRDVNRDGMTNELDAQAVLDMVSGSDNGSTYDRNAADVDGDRSITSKDARLILEQLSAESQLPDGIVPAKGKRTVSVNIRLTNAAALETVFTSGFYVEGFTFINCHDTVSGKSYEHSHSIPLLGFYGNWTDPSMFDNTSYVDTLFGTVKTPYTGVSDTNYVTIVRNGESYKVSGNPYASESSFPESRLALKSSDILYSITYSLLRSAAVTGRAISKVDGMGGNITEVAESYPYENSVDGLWFYDYGGGYGEWMNTNPRNYIFNRRLSDLGIENGDTIRAGFYAVPEYNVMKFIGGDLTSPDSTFLENWQFEEMLESNVLGRGSYLGYDFAIDDTAPEIGGERAPMLVGNILYFSASDNNYLAYVAVMSLDGNTIYNEITPKASTADLAFNIREAIENAPGYIAIFAGDYAGNERAIAVKVNDYGGTTDPSKPSDVTVSPSQIKLFRGQEYDLSADVTPVTAVDTSLRWSSSNSSVATVDQLGHITATGAGTAQIRATSNVNSSAYDSCTVTVVDLNKQLNAIIYDEESNVYFVRFNANDPSSYTKLHSTPLTENIASAFVGTDGNLYAASLSDDLSESYLYTVSTGGQYPLTQKGKNYEWIGSMAPVSTQYKDLFIYTHGWGVSVGSVNTKYDSGEYLCGVPLDTVYSGDYLGSDNYVTAVAVKSLGSTGSVFYLLDESGSIWELSVNCSSSSSVSIGVPVKVFDTGITTTFYYQDLYYDGTYLYWSNYTGYGSDLYVIDPSTWLIYNAGNFGYNVWPVLGLYVNGQVAPAGAEDEIRGEDIGENEVGRIHSFGRLTSFSGETKTKKENFEVNALPEIGYISGDIVTVNISENSTTSNGLIEINYDPDLLTLQSFGSDIEWRSFNAQEDGKFIFSYAMDESLPPGAVLLTMQFTVSCEGSELTALTKELGDSLGMSSQRSVSVEGLGHAWETPTYSWSDDYSTCTASKMCSRDASHEITETAYSNAQMISAPTLYETGYMRYEASFTDPSFETQVIGVVLPKKVLSSISMKDMPKTVYQIGESLDLQGGSILASFTDGTTQTVALSACSVTGFSSQVPGELTLTVTWEGASTTYKVLISDGSVGVMVIPYPEKALGSAYTVNGNVVTVNFALPCRIGYMSGGKYVEVPAVKGSESGYNFSVPAGIDTVILVIKGDTNQDGKLSNADSTKLKAVIKGMTAIDSVQTFASDVNGDSKLSNADSTKLKAVIKGMTTLSW